jgi:hypothetical protein
MSANISQRKLHGAIMGATVSDFTGWRLVVTCRSCCSCQSALKVGSSATSVQVVAVAGAQGYIA